MIEITLGMLLFIQIIMIRRSVSLKEQIKTDGNLLDIRISYLNMRTSSKYTYWEANGYYFERTADNLQIIYGNGCLYDKHQMLLKATILNDYDSYLDIITALVMSPQTIQKYRLDDIEPV